MLKQEESGGGGGGNGGVGGRSNDWSRTCDTCRSSPSIVYCRADSAYLCTSCDARIHSVHTVASRHERVWVCEACERAPAAFLCKADAASLCTTCDSDIHSANPLASRHQRVPILPIPGVLYGPPARSNHIIRHSLNNHSTTEDDGFLNQEVEEETIIDEDEAASWLLLDPLKNSNHHQGNTSGMQFDGEVVDEYLDLVDYNVNNHENHFIDINCNIEDQKQYNLAGQNFFEGDGMVPNRMREANHDHQLQIQHHHHHQSFNLGLQFETYPASTSYTNQVAVSCMDVIVPETAIADFSNTSQPITPKGITIDLFSNSSIQMPQQLNPMDREARVLRYREKKKARKFEKTIRYASRKAYAETRPRIKGRFAKRTNADVEVDQVLSQATGYGVVPSF